MSFFFTLDEQPRLKVLPLNNSNSRKLLALDGHDPSCGERIIRARVYALAAAWCGFAAAATAVAALLFPNRSRRSLFPPLFFLSFSLIPLSLLSTPSLYLFSLSSHLLSLSPSPPLPLPFFFFFSFSRSESTAAVRKVIFVLRGWSYIRCMRPPRGHLRNYAADKLTEEIRVRFAV